MSEQSEGTIRGRQSGDGSMIDRNIVINKEYVMLFLGAILFLIGIIRCIKHKGTVLCLDKIS